MNPTALPELTLSVLLKALVLYLLSRVLYEWVIQSVVARRPRGGWVLQALRLPGNAVHEVSHALGYLLFGYRVKRLEFSATDPEGRGICQPGAAWSPISLPWLATGAAAVLPLVAGAATLSVAAQVLGIRFADGSAEPGAWVALQVWDALRESVRALDFHRWETWAFLYLGLSIGAELAPSDTDLRRGLGPVMLAGLSMACGAWVLGSLRPDSPLWHEVAGGLKLALGRLSWVLDFGVLANLLAATVTLPWALALRLLRRAVGRQAAASARPRAKGPRNGAGQAKAGPSRPRVRIRAGK